MKKRRTLSLVMLSFMITLQANAGKFFKDDDAFFLKYLKQAEISSDPSAPAVILYEKCTTEVHPGEGLLIRHQIRRVIKINNKGGLKYADVLVENGRSADFFAEIKKISGTTYNYNQGKLVRQELDNSVVKFDKNKYEVSAKFSMPDVHEGSIIDYTYTIDEDFSLLLSEWHFQHNIPCLYSELEIYRPEQFDVTTLSRNLPYIPEIDDTRKSVHDSLLPNIYHTPIVNNGSGIVNERWVRRNIGMMYDEPFVPNLENYNERIQLKVTGVHVAAFSKSLMDSWTKINKVLYESFSFYKPLRLVHPAIITRTKELVSGITDSLEKAKKIYAFVRDNISVKSNSSIWLSKDVEQVLIEKSGTPADINLLLITMMKYVGLECDPLIVSTKDNASAIAAFPMISSFNHTVCVLNAGGQQYFLDASEKYNPFGVLPASCYNGYSRIVNAKGGAVDLTTDMCKEKTMFSINTLDNDPGNYQLEFKEYYGNTLAKANRLEWNTDTTGIRKYIRSVLKKMPVEADLINYQVQNLGNPEAALSLTYTVKMHWPEQSKNIYMTPMLMSYFKENPFKSAQRIYPVEMPQALDCVYAMQLQLPKGYEGEDIPTSELVTLDDKDQYKYMIDYSKETNMIRVNARLQMQRVSYTTEEYELLKSFFDKIIGMQQKTCVIKKAG